MKAFLINLPFFKRCIVLFSIIFISTPTISQTNLKNVGIPFISKFSRHDFEGGAQTWSITQDNRGIMYFGNNNGLMEFDGTNWEMIEMPNSAIVREVFKSSDNKIYVGAYNQFGYLVADKTGNTVYSSISDQLPSAYKEFGEIWNIIETSWGIIFQSFSSIYILTEKITPLEINQSLNFSFKVQDRVFVGHNDKGLMELTESGLNYIQGGEFFSKKTISSILGLSNGNILIGTSFSGVFLYDWKTFSKWETPISELASQNQVYCGIKLNENTFAYGTIMDGIYFFNENGETLLNVNKEKGLQNNSVLSLYIDESKNLWAALDNGINYLNINSPVSQLFPEGLIGTGYISCIWKDKIYFGTNQGLFYMDWDTGRRRIVSTEVKRVEGANGQVWNLQEFNGSLICGHHNGTYEVMDNKARQISNILGGWKYVSISSNSPYLIGGTYTGLILLRKNGERATHYDFIKKLEGFNISCREMEVDNKGYLWVSHVNKGIYRISFNTDHSSIQNVDYFNSQNGLPSDYSNSVFKLKGSVLVSTVDGIYRFNARKFIFEKDEKITAIVGTGKIDKFYEDPYENIWHFTPERLGVLRTNFQGNYYSEIIPYKELKGNFVTNYEHILATDNQSFIVATEDGFAHFDKSYSSQLHSTLKAQLRKITTSDGVLIFGGNFQNQHHEIVSNQPIDEAVELPFKHNSLQFELSANSYSKQDKIEYNFWLEGYEKDWSGWGTRSQKYYKNLKGDSYILHAKVRNEAQNESNELTYEFTVSKPIYLSPYLLIVYLIAIAGILYLIVFLVKKQIEKEKEALKHKQKKELEARKKEYEHDKLVKEQEIIQLRNEKLKIENERNLAELDNKSKELASIVMKISYSNELINRTRSQLMKVYNKMVHQESKNQVNMLIHNLEKELSKDEDWKQFEVHFDQVHENFIKSLKNQFSELTQKDLKMAAYLRMNLSTKEVAQLFNLSPRGVETSRYRLRKKLGLGKNDNLTDFLLAI